jgi:hypothetical protein
MSSLITDIIKYCFQHSDSASEVVAQQPEGPNDWDEDGERKRVREELVKFKSSHDLDEANEEELNAVGWQIEAVEESLRDYIYMMPEAELDELKGLWAKVRGAIEERREEEIRRREIEAAEKWRAEQDAFIEEVRKLVKTLPPFPADIELNLIGTEQPSAVQDHVSQAHNAVDELVAGIDVEPDVFQKLYLAAKAAIETARSGIDELPPAIAAEIDRRERQFEHQTSTAEAAQQPLSDGWDKFDKEPRSIKKLRAAVKGKDEALQALKLLVRTGEPTEFDEALMNTEQAVLTLGQRVKITNDMLDLQKRKDEQSQRARQMQELRWQSSSKLTDEQFKILDDSAPFTEMLKHRTIYLETFAQLESLKDSDASVFDEARQKTELAYEGVDKFDTAAVEAYDEVIQRRTTERTRLVDRVKSPIDGPRPLDGTPEAAELKQADNVCHAALNVLRRAIDKALPDKFASALKDATEAVDALLEVRDSTARSTGLRLDQSKQLKSQLTELAAGKRSAIPKGPSPEIVAAVEKAFEHTVAQSEMRIDGKNGEADQAVVEEFEAWLLVVAGLTKSLKAISTARFAQVAQNVTIRTDVNSLLESLGKPGISKTAVLAANSIAKRVVKVATKYAAIAELTVAYGDIKAHKYYLSQWNKEVDPYLDFERDQDNREIGDLTIGNRTFTEKFDEIDKRSRKRERADERNAAYAASAEGRFIAYWDLNERDSAVIELTRLVNEGTARYGEIKRCYLTNHDDEALEEFSVEVSVDIDGKRGVVVHAHCTYDGSPKGGNACHFKLANNKRESGNTGMLNTTLRGELLPTKDDILSAAPRNWDGYRPDYI